METGRRIGIFPVQQIINSCGEFEVFNQILAEKSQVNDPIAGGVLALHGNGLAARIGGAVTILVAEHRTAIANMVVLLRKPILYARQVPFGA